MTMKAACIGAGYFSHFHYDAWKRIPEVHVAAISDLDEDKARAVMEQYGIEKYYSDYRDMLEQEQPDFVDIITPPPTHLEICRFAADRGIAIICQKPLAPTFEEAQQIVETAEGVGGRFMVHENWRFQPWYREIRKLLDDGAIGDELFALNFRSRMGDGWSAEAYLDRQPYFRTYPRLLVYENGVHFIDTYRYLAGEISAVYSKLRKLNPVIAGEDSGVVLFEFAGGATGVWDANRYNESNRENPRYTFGEMLVEGSGGSIRLYTDGRLTLQRLGEPEQEHQYHHEDRGFAGDCCHATQRYFVECMQSGAPFETRGSEYLKTLAVQEAVYHSAEQKQRIAIEPDEQ
jgi:D-apiose dehydrogenase